VESQRTLDAGRPHAETVSARQVPLQVIATTKAGTRAALLEARQLSRRLNIGRAVLLVPWMVSSTTSVEGPPNDAAIVETYRRMADETGVDVNVRLCVCRGYGEVFRWMLPRNSTVVVGGRRRWWWPTREQRIADRLESAGHMVVFADAG
jgi:hypothetical protein